MVRSSRLVGSRLTAAAIVLLVAWPVAAQTPVSLSDNKYTPAQDVRIGRQAAEEIEQQLPLLRDRSVTSYVASLGRRLVSAIPPDLRQPDFRYTFKVINVRDLNAFALPGGPIYVNRGMIEVARTEGELAGVLAHELSHVVLRHGTAQATRATPYQLGALAGAVAGAIIGGNAGAVVSQGTQFGLGTMFLRYSRRFEREADVLGAQIMARAGYDPRHAANMFRTLEHMNGSGGPEFLSSHPNPGNRYESITREAELLRVRHPVGDTAEFRRVKTRLARTGPAPTTAQVMGSRRR